MLFPFISWVGAVAGNSRYVILVDFIQAVVCFGYWSRSPWTEIVKTYSTSECRWPTDCTDISHCRFCNYSCGTARWYGMRIGTIQSEGPWSTLLHPYHYSWSGHSTIVLYWCKISNGYFINSLRINSSYIIFCGQTKFILRLSVSSSSAVVTSRHGTILMMSTN